MGDYWVHVLSRGWKQLPCECLVVLWIKLSQKPGPGSPHPSQVSLLLCVLLLIHSPCCNAACRVLPEELIQVSHPYASKAVSQIHLSFYCVNYSIMAMKSWLATQRHVHLAKGNFWGCRWYDHHNAFLGNKLMIQCPSWLSMNRMNSTAIKSC